MVRRGPARRLAAATGVPRNSTEPSVSRTKPGRDLAQTPDRPYWLAAQVVGVERRSS